MIKNKCKILYEYINKYINVCIKIKKEKKNFEKQKQKKRKENQLAKATAAKKRNL